MIGSGGRDRTCDHPINSRPLYHSATPKKSNIFYISRECAPNIKQNWWRKWVMIPPRQSCKDRLHPGAFPEWWQEEESNLRRRAFQTRALPLSYLAVFQYSENSVSNYRI